MSRLESTASFNVRTSAATRLLPPSMSTISLFLANLRLLDLDLRDDWLNITNDTFDTRTVQQDLKRRVASVEWSLYLLFEIYDPATTREVSRTEKI